MPVIFENATLVPVTDLNTYHRNPRRGDVDAIAASLSRTGMYRPAVVNRGTLTGRPNEVLAGNHTLAAAKQLGWDQIAVSWLDVDDETARRIVLADNRTADLGGYDDSELLALLTDMTDLDGTGYDSDDLLALMGAAFEEPAYRTDPDDAPPAPDEPKARRGEVWQLGPHRVICGDATSTSDLAKLMGDDTADVLWTDPPYGVNVVGGDHILSQAERIARGGRSFSNDTKDGLARLVLESFIAASGALRPGAPFYCAHSDTHAIEFRTAIEAAGYSVRQNLVWVKNRIVPGRSDYHYMHEPILYGFTRGGEGRLGRGGSRWFGDNTQTTVFHVDKPLANRDHPTSKPVALVKAMLSNSAPVGGIVLDVFAGSGSTLIAADSLGMRARLVELDPRFVDVVIERYSALTGIAPELIAES